LLADTIKVAVSIGETHAGIAALIIDIEADLWAEPQPLALVLRTEVDVETGRVAIENSSPQRAH
jgi:type VI secretion system protein ImpF